MKKQMKPGDLVMTVAPLFPATFVLMMIEGDQCVVKSSDKGELSLMNISELEPTDHRYATIIAALTAQIDIRDTARHMYDMGFTCVTPKADAVPPTSFEGNTPRFSDSLEEMVRKEVARVLSATITSAADSLFEGTRVQNNHISVITRINEKDYQEISPEDMRKVIESANNARKEVQQTVPEKRKPDGVGR